MLTISDLTKSFAGRVLFEDAGLQINPGDRIGLVGPNGAGKSTLFSIIMGDAEPDEGSVSLKRGTRIGFLPQEHARAGDETVLDLACSVTPELTEAIKAMRGSPDHSDEHHEAYGHFAESDGH